MRCSSLIYGIVAYTLAYYAYVCKARVLDCLAVRDYEHECRVFHLKAWCVALGLAVYFGLTNPQLYSGLAWYVLCARTGRVFCTSEHVRNHSRGFTATPRLFTTRHSAE